MHPRSVSQAMRPPHPLAAPQHQHAVPNFQTGGRLRHAGAQGGDGAHARAASHAGPPLVKGHPPNRTEVLREHLGGRYPHAHLSGARRRRRQVFPDEAQNLVRIAESFVSESGKASPRVKVPTTHHLFDRRKSGSRGSRDTMIQYTSFAKVCGTSTSEEADLHFRAPTFLERRPFCRASERRPFDPGRAVASDEQ